MRGRAASPVRTGLWIRSYLLTHGEECLSEMHRALKEEIAAENQRRPKAIRIKPPTYESFVKYVHNLERLGLVQFSGREEPLEFPPHDKLLQMRVNDGKEIVPSVRRYYRITSRGRNEVEPWANPIRALGYQKVLFKLFC